MQYLTCYLSSVKLLKQCYKFDHTTSYLIVVVHLCIQEVAACLLVVSECSIRVHYKVYIYQLCCLTAVNVLVPFHHNTSGAHDNTILRDMAPHCISNSTQNTCISIKYFITMMSYQCPILLQQFSANQPSPSSVPGSCSSPLASEHHCTT